jgi:murein L,D-transpeptidase YcbB/YkuD
MRWMPADLGERYVMVNIPAFQLTAVERGRAVLRMQVVVGEPDWQTPVLSDTIVDFKFAPTWTVPTSILRQEMLAQIRRDPGYLERKGLRVFRAGREISPWSIDWNSVTAGSGYVLRQDPGPRNALGQIRFSLTNPLDIYLHDTPATRAFAQANRALSHGCVRVAQPEELALFVLGGDPAWDRARIERAMSARNTHFHTLERPVPTYLVYFTAWVDESGTPQFREDVYGRDKELLAALERRSEWTPPAI